MLVADTYCYLGASPPFFYNRERKIIIRTLLCSYDIILWGKERYIRESYRYLAKNSCFALMALVNIYICSMCACVSTCVSVYVGGQRST